MTEGTLASSRTTGWRMLRIHSGANSTMNTETKSEETNAIATAENVISGPALIELAHTTVAVPHGATLTTGRLGELRLNLKEV